MTNAEELDGMLQLIALNQQLAQTNPEAIMYLDVEKIEENGLRLFGAPSDIIRHPDKVEELIEEQKQAEQQQQTLNQAEQVEGNGGE